jgi:hypothetical protein
LAVDKVVECRANTLVLNTGIDKHFFATLKGIDIGFRCKHRFLRLGEILVNGPHHAAPFWFSSLFMIIVALHNFCVIFLVYCALGQRIHQLNA